MLTVTAPVGQRAAHGPQYQHSSTCMNALPVSGLMASESSGQTSTHRVQPSIHSDSSIVTGTSARLVDQGHDLLLIQVAAHGDSIAAHADVLQIDGPAVVQAGEPLEHEQRRTVGHLQRGRRMRVGGDRLQRQRRRAQPLSADLLDEREHVVGFQRVAQQLGADIRGEIGQVEAERQVAEIPQPLDEHHLLAVFQPQPAGHRRRAATGIAARTSLRTSPWFLNVSFSPSSASSPWSYLRCATCVPTLGPRSIRPSCLENGERLANGVAGDEEFGGQLVLGGQAVGVGAGVDLLAQHVGDPAGTVGAGPPDRRWFG